MLKHNETDFDSDNDGMFTAEDVYGATSDFWAGSEDTEEPADSNAHTEVTDRKEYRSLRGDRVVPSQ
jgi:hypothetical protein